jgi:glycosyltransferase involved in cell wall biosynthesis
MTLSELTQVVSDGFRLVHVAPGNEKEFKGWEQWADVIVFQGHALELFSTLQASKKRLIIDVYDPMHFEQLEQSRHEGKKEWTALVAGAADAMERQFQRGDYFLCATERQRHLYLGQLMTLGRITPDTYENDPNLENLMGIVPFGLPAEPPQKTAPAMRGVVPGIGQEDKIILWSGGLYNWFDPFTLIHAVSELSRAHSDVKLYFQGTKHPHPGVPEMAIVDEARALAQSLGILDHHVFFNDSWVPYHERSNFLLEADCGVSTHRDHVETTFSFRTRVLDYLWAELPMVVTRGDYFGDLVDAKGLIGSPEQTGTARAILEGRTHSYLLHDGSAEGGPVIMVTQTDIRAIQLAKSALYAGARLLMDEMGVDTVDRVVLAGAFGAHISPKHAMVLGMIPDAALDHVTSAGNAAGTGARIALCNVGARNAIEATVHEIHKVETAIEPRFQEHFVNASAIPNSVDTFPELGLIVTLPDVSFNTSGSGGGADGGRRRRRG